MGDVDYFLVFTDVEDDPMLAHSHPEGLFEAFYPLHIHFSEGEGIIL